MLHLLLLIDLLLLVDLLLLGGLLLLITIEDHKTTISLMPMASWFSSMKSLLATSSSWLVSGQLIA
jgi:hypothetical protein